MKEILLRISEDILKKFFQKAFKKLTLFFVSNPFNEPDFEKTKRAWN